MTSHRPRFSKAPSDVAVFRYCLISLMLLAGCGRSSLPTLSSASLGSASLLNKSQSAYHVVYYFEGGKIGSAPQPSSQLLPVNGNLYGTTEDGGTNACGHQGQTEVGCGTVFEVTPNGGFKTIHSFALDSNGFSPFGLLVVGNTFYGSASNGTSGLVFSMSITGKERVLFVFKPQALGPGTLVASGGALYGTTPAGGDLKCKSEGRGGGCGTLFKLAPSPKGIYEETVLHRFSGGPDGFGGGYLTFLDGSLYGSTAFGGGAAGCGAKINGCGTIFRVTPSRQYSVIYRFKSFADGQYPGRLYALKDRVYGLTTAGGTANCGTFFSVTTTGVKQTLYSFKGNADGCFPTGALVYQGGLFYGVTSGSGSPYQRTGFLGTVFAVSTTGEEQVIHNFQKSEKGALPTNGLTPLNNELFGTTFSGGKRGCLPHGFSGCGVIFGLTPSHSI
jgi:uncharacterized repeat protein (TIGR03803 family)